MERSDASSLSERELSLCQGYNKLEEILKLSQLVTFVFDRSVLNEVRYFTRAFVDFRSADAQEDSEQAYGRAQNALSAAYTDVLDALVNYIKVSVLEIRTKFTHAKVFEHLDELKYESALKAMNLADKLILHTRTHRSERFAKYTEFAESEHFNELVEFAFNLMELERRCELDKGSSSRKIELNRIKWVREALINTINDPKKPRLELFLQPKFLADSGEISGVEGLIRLWVPNIEYPLTPNIFLEAAHNANLGHKIGMWVLHDAIRIVKQWKSKYDIPELLDFSINLSPSLAGDDTFNEAFTEEVRKNRVVNHISIEITEDWIEEADEYKSVSHCVNSLPQKTKIAIDDFGTGTTKLEYIAKIDGLSTIKIDKTLIDGLITKNHVKTELLINGIVALAKKNDLRVVAEGIEEQTQFDLLVSLGVDELQGYFLSRPIKQNEFEATYLSKYVKK